MRNKLMVVDSDTAITDALYSALTEAGYTVRVAHNGVDALRLLASEPPDVMLMDLAMPELDGAGVAATMQTHDHGQELIPLVIVSGVLDVDRIAEQIGTPYVLSKPFGLAPLLSIVALALREMRAPVPQKQRL